jgi:hypothetical protein
MLDNMDEGNIGATSMFFLDYKHWKWWILWNKETWVGLLCSFWTISIELMDNMD